VLKKPREATLTFLTLHYKIKYLDLLVSRICGDRLCSKAHKISSLVRYFPVYILIKERKLRIVSDLPTDRLADFIASVPETNPVTGSNHLYNTLELLMMGIMVPDTC
jgi:hypothetical protein